MSINSDNSVSLVNLTNANNQIESNKINLKLDLTF